MFLNQQLLQSLLIDVYIYSGRKPIKEEVFECLVNQPSVLQARVIGIELLLR